MSTTTGLESRIHPIARFTTRLHAALGAVGEAPTWSMSLDEQRDTLVALARAEARLAALRLRVLVAADASDVAAATSATSTAAWLAHATIRNRGAAHREVTLALALEHPHRSTRDALAAGLVDLDQARVIVEAVDALAGEAGADVTERAEKHLVHLAGQHDAKELRTLGRRVFEVVDPEAADLAEGLHLERGERSAARASYLTVTDNGDGTHTGRFKLSTLHTAMLSKALTAFSSPRQRPDAGNGPVALTRPELRGEAFARLLERLPADRLPQAGGLSATVVVLLDYDRLLSGLGTATLDSGERISAGTARRLNCESGVIPAVYRRMLGGPSVVLDLGRRTRFHTEAQRLSLAIRDHGCTAEGCDRPPAWCHAHHDTPWSRGGGTSLDNGRLLCAFHHGRAHSPAYDLTRLASGQVRVHRRT
ncbi:MAG: DUF222 domain-containing protein [Nocardioidaceae bacterium]